MAGVQVEDVAESHSTMATTSVPKGRMWIRMRRRLAKLLKSRYVKYPHTNIVPSALLPLDSHQRILCKAWHSNT